MKACATILMDYVSGYKSDPVYLDTKPACLVQEQEGKEEGKREYFGKDLGGGQRGSKGTKFLCLTLTTDRTETTEYSTISDWPVEK